MATETAGRPDPGGIGQSAPSEALPQRFTLDALMPADIAAKAETVGVAKAGMQWRQMFMLSVLAGAFIGLGAMFATTVTAGTGGAVPFGVVRLLAGVAFSLGLILVVVAGAELFTGNNLIAMAWADRRVSMGRLLRNWGIVYAGNLVGALATVALVYVSKQYTFGDDQVGLAALTVGEAKSDFGFGQAVALGMLCNALVCLAIWMTYSARTVIDKVVAIIFPITAFVAAGFEHSVANMYFLPMSLLIKAGASDSFWAGAGKTSDDFPNLTVGHAVFSNLLPVTIGNIIGGSLMVGLVYWLIYIRSGPARS